MAGSRIPDVFDAAVDALRADATLTGSTLLNGAKVYSLVPEDTVPPYLWILGGREVIWAEAFRSDAAREVDIDAIAISKHRGTKEVDDIISRVIEVLDFQRHGLVSVATQDTRSSRIELRLSLRWREKSGSSVLCSGGSR